MPERSPSGAHERCDHLRRLLKAKHYPSALEEGAHGGTRGSPVKRAKRSELGETGRLFELDRLSAAA